MTAAREVTVSEWLAVRAYYWLPAWPTLLPFCLVMLPMYSGPAMQMLSSVFFNAPMEREWLAGESADAADRLMSYPPMGMFSGWMFGALAWTVVSDRHGRRLAMLGCGWAGILLAAATSASWSYGSFFAMRTLCGFAFGGQGAVAYVWTMEWATTRDLGLLTFAGNVAFSLANILLVGVAYLGRELELGWRVQNLVLCAIQTLPFALATCVVRESPRFLLQTGRPAEAEEAIRAVLSPEAALATTGFTLALEGSRRPSHCEPTSPPTHGPSARHLLLEAETLRRLAVVTFAWFGVNLLFYGLDFAVAACKVEDGCNIYTNGILTAVADLPGYVFSFAAADSPQLGRRLTLVLSFAVSGGCLLTMAILRATAGVTTGDLGLGALHFVGKCGAASAFSLVYIYPTELFPTKMRSSALGVANVGGRIAAMLSPLAANLPAHLLELGLGSLALAAAVLMLTLPETGERQSAAAPLAQQDALAVVPLAQHAQGYCEEEVEGGLPPPRRNGGGRRGHRSPA